MLQIASCFALSRSAQECALSFCFAFARKTVLIPAAPSNICTASRAGTPVSAAIIRELI